jgi:hypothetical protein
MAGALTSDERTSCGVGACRLKKRSAAGGYHAASTGRGAAAIEKACTANGISLADPCETNPLKCQK